MIPVECFTREDDPQIYLFGAPRVIEICAVSPRGPLVQAREELLNHLSAGCSVRLLFTGGVARLEFVGTNNINT